MSGFLQRRMLAEDGTMGTHTTENLKTFLRANGCDPDGFERFFPPMKVLTNGIEWQSASLTGWDRTTKAALKQFLNDQGYDAGEVKWFNSGHEWDAKAIKALVWFLNDQGANLASKDEQYPGMFSATFSIMSRDTIQALQHFLNTKGFVTQVTVPSGAEQSMTLGSLEKNRNHSQ